MLPKKNRATTAQVERLFKGGKTINSTYLSFRYILTPSTPTLITDKDAQPLVQEPFKAQISFIAPKNVAKLAVARNKLRRIGYAALQNHLGSFPNGTIGAFVFKKAEQNVSVIENEIKNILDKIN